MLNYSSTRSSGTKVLSALIIFLFAFFDCSKYSGAWAGEQSPSLVVNTGHGNLVSAVAFSPDGKSFATASWDRTIKVWDAEKNCELFTLAGPQGHKNNVLAVAFGDDGRWLTTVGLDKRMSVWDINSGKFMLAIKDLPIDLLRARGGALASGITSGEYADTVFTWESARPKKKFLHAGLSSIELTTKGDRLVTGGSAGTIKVWNAENGQEVFQLNQGKERIISLSVDLSDKLLAAGSWDRSVIVWNLDSKQKSFEIKEKSEPLSLCFSDKLGLLVENLNDGTVTVRRTANGEPFWTLPTKMVRSIAVSADGDRILCGTANGDVEIWDIKSKAKTFSAARQVAPVYSVDFDRSGEVLAVNLGNTVSLWDLNEFSRIATMRGNGPVKFNQSGNSILISSSDGPKLWSIQEQKEQPLALSKDAIAQFDNDGKPLLATFEKEILSVRNPATNEELLKENMHFEDGNSAHFATFPHLNGHFKAFNSDATKLLFCYQNHVSVFDLRSRKRILFEQLIGLDLSKLGPEARFASVDDLEQLDVSPEQMEVLGSVVSCAAFSPDGKSVAVGTGRSNKVRIWSLSDGSKTVLETYSASSPVQCLSFSNDGKLLVAGTFDGSILIWNLATQKLPITLSGHSEAVSSVRFNQAGILASGSVDGSVMLWKDGARLCTIVPLTTDVWVAVDSYGRFDSNNIDSISELHWRWRKNPDARPSILPVECFFRQSYEPTLVSKLLKNLPLKPVPPLLETNLLQPAVRIDYVKPSRRSENEVEVSVSFKSEVQTNADGSLTRSGVYELRLFRDGKMVAYAPRGESFSSERRIDLTAADPGSKQSTSGGVNAHADSEEWITEKFVVQLPWRDSNKYVFSAYAFNDERIKCKTVSCEYTHKKTLPRQRGVAYIVSFGVDDYQDSSWNLRYAAADARSYSESLSKSIEGTRRFQPKSIKLISAKDRATDELLATKENLKQVLLALAGKPIQSKDVRRVLKAGAITPAKPDDVVILSFSCHGSVNPSTNEYYLLPFDIGAAQQQGGNPDFEKSGISSSELSEWLKDLDVSDLTMVIDSCYSGAVERPDFKPGPMDDAGFGQLAYYKRMRLLTASQATDVAKEKSSLGHGLLTFALLRIGLDEDGRADTSPKDGVIDIAELLKFAKEQVPVLDAGNFRKRSIDDAMQRNIGTLLTPNQKRSVQSPKLLNFAIGTNAFPVLKLTSGSN
jgi:WD40 repeat protein